MQVDNIVMMHDNNAIRGNWIIGRIMEAHPGQGGQVCEVKAKRTAKHIVTQSQRLPLSTLQKDMSESANMRTMPLSRPRMFR